MAGKQAGRYRSKRAIGYSLNNQVRLLVFVFELHKQEVDVGYKRDRPSLIELKSAISQSNDRRMKRLGEQLKVIERLAKDGLDTKSIAVRAGCSTSKVQAYRKSMGLGTKQTPGYLLPDGIP